MKNISIKLAIFLVTVTMAGSVFAWDGSGMNSNSSNNNSGRHMMTMMDSGNGHHHDFLNWGHHQGKDHVRGGWNQDKNDIDISGR